MGAIFAYVGAHWVSWVISLALAALSFMYRRLSKQLEKERNRMTAVNEGVLALLHDRLYQACQYYLKKGFCELEDRDNLEYMFKPYKALGGNGTGEELYNRCLALPYEDELLK